MDRFENELKQALRRREPAGDFAARLMARVARERDRQPWWRFTSVRLRWATAAVAFCILAAAAIMYRPEQQRRSAEGEAARQQVYVALHIAGANLRLAKSSVQNLSD